MKACVVLDMFKTFIRLRESVVQMLKNEVLYYYNTRVSFCIAHSSCSSVFEDFLVFLAGLFVSYCSIFEQI